MNFSVKLRQKKERKRNTIPIMIRQKKTFKRYGIYGERGDGNELNCSAKIAKEKRIFENSLNALKWMDWQHHLIVYCYYFYHKRGLLMRKTNTNISRSLEKTNRIKANAFSLLESLIANLALFSFRVLSFTRAFSFAFLVQSGLAISMFCHIHIFQCMYACVWLHFTTCISCLATLYCDRVSWWWCFTCLSCRRMEAWWYHSYASRRELSFDLVFFMSTFQSENVLERYTKIIINIRR